MLQLRASGTSRCNRGQFTYNYKSENGFEANRDGHIMGHFKWVQILKQILFRLKTTVFDVGAYPRVRPLWIITG
ncbi:MAG: hypothetical protein Q9P44_06040 [Anaerolineae bacterium]|nr:hypothetical protein [Anaerolineae bacterium]